MENEFNNDVLKIANELQFNDKAEADAIMKYTKAIDMTMASELDEETKFAITSNLREIIADELNHQKKLTMMFEMLTDIEAKGD